MSISLERYHGLGNDYLVLNPNRFDLALNERIIRRICDRNLGVVLCALIQA